MLEQDHELGHALGTGGAHVVLTHDVQQAGTHQAGDVCRGVDCQCGDRHDIRCSAVQAHGGQQLEVHTELIQQQHAGNKARDRNAAGCEHDDGVVQPLAAVVSRDTAQRDADAQGHQHRHACQAAGHRQLAGDDLVDRAATLTQAQAQVAVQQALHVIDVLHTQRLVQAVFLGQCLLSSRTDGLFCHERAAGDQVHDKKGNRGHNEDAEDAHCDTLDDVLCHRLMPLHSYQ